MIPGLPPAMSMSPEDKRQVYGSTAKRTAARRKDRVQRMTDKIDVLAMFALPIFVILVSILT